MQSRREHFDILEEAAVGTAPIGQFRSTHRPRFFLGFDSNPCAFSWRIIRNTHII